MACNASSWAHHSHGATYEENPMNLFVLDRLSAKPAWLHTMEVAL